MKRLALILFSFLMLSTMLTACGSSGKTAQSSSSSQGKPAMSLNVTAVNFHFNKKTYTIPANKNVKVNFKSLQGFHGFSIVGTSINIRGKGSEIINLKPGTYTIKCSVPCGSGHSKMKSTLIVQ